MNFYEEDLPEVQLNAEQSAFLDSCSKEQKKDVNYISERLHELRCDSEARAMQFSLKISPFKEQSVEIIRKLLTKAGTDVNKNDRDPYGDGDQSLLYGKGRVNQRQILCNLFDEGGDIDQHLAEGSRGFTDLAWSCIKGDTKAVAKKLKAASLEGQKALTEIMEYRETSLRLSPLLLTVALSKRKLQVYYFTRREIRDMDHVGVFRTLIRYGARPDAKDVTGRTVCHRGASATATDETLEMTSMAVKATQSCAFFGHEVVLSGLNKVQYNGVKGTLGGFVVETERRVFYPEAGSLVEQELGVKPENIFVEREDDEGVMQLICILESPDGTRTNLIDNRDRMGMISMHMVALIDRDDVAKFLCKHSTTCLDVADVSGITTRQWLCNFSSLFMPIKVMSVLKIHAAKLAARCANCDKAGKSLECSQCFSVTYCSKECQVSHWKCKHKKDCKRLRKQGKLVLGHSKEVGMNHYFTQASDPGFTDKEYNYGPPTVLKDAGDCFWVKVQNRGIEKPLMIYDQTRICNFVLPPGEDGHRELVEKVSLQQTFIGRESFFRARFDEQGRCVVYINSTAALYF